MKEKFNNQKKGKLFIDWGRQGETIFAYGLALLGYYGIIANTIMFDKFGNWISYVNMDKKYLIWPFLTYFINYSNPLFNFLKICPILLLFILCFWLTYKEDIPHYGIKASLWLVPLIISEGFIFYIGMSGFTLEPFILQFLNVQGYINILSLNLNIFAGALSGMYLKKWIIKKYKV